MILDDKEFFRPDPLSREGFAGSGADWLDRYKPFLEDGKTVVGSPHKMWGPQTNDLVFQGRAKGRVAKAVLIGAMPPLMVKTPANPVGLPLDVFDGFRAALLADRAQFFRDIPNGPFYGFNGPGARASQGVIDNWWRQGKMCSIKAAYDCIKAFSETDFTDDLRRFDVPTLIMHGADDQIVPIGATAMQSSRLVTGSTLKVYPGAPHGLMAEHVHEVNNDLLTFLEGRG